MCLRDYPMPPSQHLLPLLLALSVWPSAAASRARPLLDHAPAPPHASPERQRGAQNGAERTPAGGRACWIEACRCGSAEAPRVELRSGIRQPPNPRVCIGRSCAERRIAMRRSGHHRHLWQEQANIQQEPTQASSCQQHAGKAVDHELLWAEDHRSIPTQFGDAPLRVGAGLRGCL